MSNKNSIDFETFKKQFDESFGKVTPSEFVKEMESVGYKFLPEQSNVLPSDAEIRKEAEAQVWKGSSKRGYLVDKYNLEENPFDLAKWMRSQAESVLVKKDSEIMKITGDENPFPLENVLEKFVDATKMLLDKYNYDGSKHEEFLHCVKRGEEIIDSIKLFRQGK